ncbi:MAG: DNA polymerase III subunit beta [Pseudomonadota bacterium]
MKATLERQTLLKSLSHVHRVVERRNTIPILSNVLIKAEGSQVDLKATDLDLEIVDSAEAMVERGGATTVPAHLLYEIVRKLPDGTQVVLDAPADGAQMSLSAGRASFALQMLPESDFPDITAGTFSHTFELSGANLKRLIDRTQFAISNEETRYYLNGIYFHTVEQGADMNLRAVATDGHRLAQAEMKAPVGAESIPGVIVPRKAVGEIQRLLEEPDQNVKVELSDSKVRLTVGPVILTSKLIDGTFPDYERVIPRGNDKELQVDRDVFKEAVDRVSTVSSERGRAVKLTLSDGHMVLMVNNPDSGSATEELAVEYGAGDLDIGFNSRYLLDITNQLEADTATFLLADPGSPTLIRDPGDEHALYVLMPMRV